MSETNKFLFPEKTELFPKIKKASAEARRQLFEVGLGIALAQRNEVRVQFEAQLPDKLKAIGANQNNGTMLIFVNYLKGLGLPKESTTKQKEEAIAKIYKENGIRS